MIEINLLPEELKPQQTHGAFDKRKFLYAVPAVIVVLIVFHLFLSLNQLFTMQRLARLTKQWKSLDAQLSALHPAKNTADAASAADQRILSALAPRPVYWAKKLHALSTYLPNGIWFTGIAVSPSDFVLRGTVISLEQEEMKLINTFMNNLKKDKEFSDAFVSIALDKVQKSQIGSYGVVNFAITATLNTKEQKK